MRSPGNVRKPQTCPLPLSQNAAKWEKWTDRSQRLIISQGNRDLSACHISAHSSQAFSRKYTETPNLTCLTSQNAYKRKKNEQTVKKIESVLKEFRIHQHDKFQAIPPKRSLEYAQQPKSEPSYWCFGLGDLGIRQVSLTTWEPNVVGASNDLVNFHGNRWWNVLTKAGKAGRTNKALYSCLPCHPEVIFKTTNNQRVQTSTTPILRSVKQSTQAWNSPAYCFLCHIRHILQFLLWNPFNHVILLTNKDP